MRKTRLALVFLIATVAATISATAPAQRVPARSQPDVRAGAAVATTEAQARPAALDDAIDALDELARRPMPRGLTRAEQNNWREQTAWLASVRDRYRELSGSYGTIASDATPPIETAAPPIPGGAVVSAGVSNAGRAGDSNGRATSVRSPASDAVAQLDSQLSALQTAVEAEGRRFQTLSNASKARSDTAMSIIQNIK